MKNLFKPFLTNLSTFWLPSIQKYLVAQASLTVFYIARSETVESGQVESRRNECVVYYYAGMIPL